MTRFDFKDTDRVELTFHEDRAKRGFTRGGMLLVVATALLLLTGWYTATLFGVPAAALFIAELRPSLEGTRPPRASGRLPIMRARFVWLSASSA